MYYIIIWHNYVIMCIELICNVKINSTILTPLGKLTNFKYMDDDSLGPPPIPGIHTVNIYWMPAKQGTEPTAMSKPNRIMSSISSDFTQKDWMCCFHKVKSTQSQGLHFVLIVHQSRTLVLKCLSSSGSDVNIKW